MLDSQRQSFELSIIPPQTRKNDKRGENKTFSYICDTCVCKATCFCQTFEYKKEKEKWFPFIWANDNKTLLVRAREKKNTNDAIVGNVGNNRLVALRVAIGCEYNRAK
jgi:hypothetical protein